MVADQLDRMGIENFLPLVKRTRQWSDRVKEVELPLFSGYSFVRLHLTAPERLRVLQTHGVAGFVGINFCDASIPDEQIEAIRTVLLGKVAVSEHPFLEAGQRIRVRGGALDGLEGILLEVDSGRRLILSVEPIQRSISINLDGYQVEVIS